MKKLSDFFEKVDEVNEKEVLEQFVVEEDPLKKEFLRALFNYKLGISQ